MPRRAAAIALRCLSHIPPGQTAATAEANGFFTVTLTGPCPVKRSAPAWREVILLAGRAKPPSSEAAPIMQLRACRVRGLDSPSAIQKGGTFLMGTAANRYTESQSRYHRCTIDVYPQLSPAFSCWELRPSSKSKTSALSSTLGVHQSQVLINFKSMTSAATPQQLPRDRPGMRQGWSFPRAPTAAHPSLRPQARSGVAETTVSETRASESAASETTALGATDAVAETGAVAGASSVPEAEEGAPKPRRRKAAQEADPQGAAVGTPKPRKARAPTATPIGTPTAEKAATGAPSDVSTTTGSAGRGRKASAGSSSGTPRARKAAPRAKRVVKRGEKSDGTTANGFLGETPWVGLHPLVQSGLSLATGSSLAQRDVETANPSFENGPSLVTASTPPSSASITATVSLAASDGPNSAGGSMHSNVDSGLYSSNGRRILGVGIDPDVSGALALLWARTAREGDLCQLTLAVPDSATQEAAPKLTPTPAAAATAASTAVTLREATEVTPPEAEAVSPPEDAAAKGGSPDGEGPSFHAVLGVQVRVVHACFLFHVLCIVLSCTCMV